MTTSIIPGQTTWKMQRDAEGHREYKLTVRVRGAFYDGPAAVLQTPGLPEYGAIWNVGKAGYPTDIDVYAWCRWDAAVTPIVTGEPNTQWEVEFTFSTKPPDNKNCKTVQVEDPLLEPNKVSGGSTNYQEEATQDLYGNPIVNSAWEQLRGAQVEFDANRPNIKIEQNVPLLQLALCVSMVDNVNLYPLWGLNPRQIKLSKFNWERKFIGVCSVYYVRTFEFDVRDTFDRVLLDEGNKVLRGKWVQQADKTYNYTQSLDVNGNPLNHRNPTSFDQYKDVKGNNIRGLLNGAGLPAQVGIGEPLNYLCISDEAVMSSTPLTSSWIPLTATSDYADWIDVAVYQYGEVVEHLGEYWAQSYYPSAPVGAEPGISTGYWILLTNPPANQGTFSSFVAYNNGDYVTYSAPTGTGQIPIVKYPAQDFTLLGIPITF